MPQIPRYLITVEDEKTWKHDRPVIFLGEWCRSYCRRHLWQSMNAVVAQPYGVSQKQKEADLALARELENIIFPEVCAVLNKHHGTTYGERFWRVVFGHWFRRFVDVVLNRVQSLKQCIKSNTINGTTVYSDECYSLATLNSYSAIWSFNEPRFNSVLTGKILKMLEGVNFPVEIISDCREPNAVSVFRFQSKPEPKTSYFPIRHRVERWITSVSKGLVRSNDVFIINSYLPPKETIKLQLYLRQFPQYWRTPNLEFNIHPDRQLRIQLGARIINDSANDIAKILKHLVFQMLPSCYLEGFKEIQRIANRQPWPKAPKIVFTSNNFDTDEVFKVWLATKIESGSKYFVGQHGNNYGTYRYMFPTIEEKTADKFLTWGWSDGLPQHTPTFVLTAAGRKMKQYNPVGGLLLVEVPLAHRITTWDSTIEFVEYFGDQLKFVSKLNSGPKKCLTIRLHSGSKYTNWCEKERWNESNPELVIDCGTESIRKLIKKSRLVVYSYDSTGILETLSSNIPTIAFWQNGLDHVRESAEPYYQILVDAGIVHLTSESAASMVNQVWSDVESWWRQDKVQIARIKFCQRYANVSVSPVRDLIKHFKSDHQ